MKTMIILGVIVFVIIIYNFIKDVNAKEKELMLQGGIKNKYRELISYFDDFDINKLPVILIDEPNFYQMGWSGQTTISSICLFEVGDSLNIEFKIDYNIPSLQRSGIDVKKLPSIYKKKTWRYSNKMDQFEIIHLFAEEIKDFIS